jgi:D-serine deaminase-like pyridoxal phosphate-dependent protein
MVVDHAVHLDRAREAARACRARLPLVVDVDVSYRPLGDALPLGVKRSPLHDPEDVAAFVAEITRSPELVFAGLLAYEAHVAGVPDRSGGAPVLDAAKRLVKERAIQAAKLQRAAIVDALRARGIAVPLFDGGGSGSVHLSALDPSLTEIAAGSGFVDSHLFDGYRGLPLAPAAFFALEVTREPRPGIVTCQSGGFVASGAAGVDRLPRPALPEGLSLTGLEGAGEVQTPLVVPRGVRLGVGDPVFFRHAKAGELAEHFDEYLFVRGDRVVDRAKTYRGEGHAFH